MRVDPIRDDGLALLAGLALPLAFAPAGWYPLALVSPLLLLLAWKNATPRRAFLRGWLYGAGAFGVGVSWIHESFQFSNIGLALAIPLTLALVAFLALYPALLGFFVGRVAAVSGPRRLLTVFPAAWVLVEWLRGWLLTGFTWLQLGYSQLESPLAGFFPLVGVYGVSWLVALAAALVFVAFSGGRRRRIACAVGLAGILASGAGLKTLEFTREAGPAIRVSLLQGNIPQDQKWLPEMRQPTLDRYSRFTREAADADLIVWPETAVPAALDRMQGFIRALDADARARDTAVIFGIPSADASTRRYFNSLVLIGPERGLYHKRHLVPFGEYLPLDSLLRPLTRALRIPVSNFSPGPARQPLFTAAGHPVSVSICYEIAFGGEIIRDLPRARLLVTVSNDAWFGTSIGPHQHFEIARARAAETGRYVLRATNTGITAIIAPGGEVVRRAPQFEAAVLSGEAVPRSGATPYVRWGDTPVVVAALLAAGLPLVMPRKNRS